MTYDKTWTFSLNQEPNDQTTSQKQCQSFLFALKEFMKTAGWTVVYSQSKALANFNNLTTIKHTETLLTDGRVLIMGGSASGELSTTYFGTITNNSIAWVAGTPLPIAIYDHTATLLPDGRILVTGGTNAGGISAATYFGTVTGNSITWIAGTNLSVATYAHTTTLLPDGRILMIGGVAPSAVANTYFGTISGDTITWAAGTAYGATVYDHGCVLLSDGRIVVSGGVRAGAASNAHYFGTISGNTITWAVGSSSPVTLNTHTIDVLSDGRLFIAGSASSTATYFGVISGTNISWSSGTVLLAINANHTVTVLSAIKFLLMSSGTATAIFGYISASVISYTTFEAGFADKWASASDINWNSPSLARSYILLKSPVGLVAGADGSYLGEQSKLLVCLEAVSGATNEYSKINLTMYLSAVPIEANSATIPTGGISINTSGFQFINNALTQARFNFSRTSEGGIIAAIGTKTTGKMTSLLYILPLVDVQAYGLEDYPYAAVLGGFYWDAVANMSAPQVFDQVGNNSGDIVLFSHDGTVGIPREMHLYSLSTGTKEPGTGTSDTGDINGNILNWPIYIYNAAVGHCAMVGRLPDIYGIVSTGIPNGAVIPATGTITHSLINQILLPADVAFVL